MNFKKSKILILVLVVCLMFSTMNLSGVLAIPAETADLTLDVTGTAPTDVGNIFQVAVNLQNISSGLLRSADIAVYFDPTKLQIVKTDGTPTTLTTLGFVKSISSDFGAVGASIDNTVGLARYAIYIQPDAADPDTGELYSVTGYPVTDIFKIVGIRFKVIATGDTKLQIATSGVAPASVDGFPEGKMAYLSSDTILGDINYTYSQLVIGSVAADKAVLSGAITDATTLINSKTVGAAVGNVPQAAKDTFQAAIDAASAVNENAGATQAQVDEQVTLLASATTAFNESIIVAVGDSADLTLDINGTTPTAIGNIFQIDVNLKNVSSGLFFSSDVAVYYDPTKLQIVKADGTPTASATLGFVKAISSDFGAVGATIDNTVGVARYAIYIQPDAANPDTGDLYATTGYPVGAGTLKIVGIRFKVIALGDTKLQIAKQGVAPAFADGFPEGAMAYLGSSDVLGTVNYTNVPLIVVFDGVDKTILADAITAATTLKDSKTVGLLNGNVTQAAKNTFQAAISAATTVNNDANATQLQVNAQVTLLQDATTAFNNSIIVIDKSVLDAAITAATTLKDSKTVGTENGNVPQEAKDTYQLAIDAASAVSASNVTQAQVNAAVTALAVATGIFNDSVIQPGIIVKKYDLSSSNVFSTLSLATDFVMIQPDSVKGANSAVTVNYFGVSADPSTEIANRNLSLSKIVVSNEIASATIPDGAAIWVSTNSSGTPLVTSTDCYTKGVNAFSTVQEAYSAANIGSEIIVKDGNYDVDGMTISKKVIIRSGSLPVITGNMIFDALAAGSTIEGITFEAIGGTTTITVNSPDITIANLNLDNVVLIVNASNVAIQNVTATNPPVGTPVISINAGANDTNITGFAFTENTIDAGAAITVAAGVAGTTISDSVVKNSNSTILYEDGNPPLSNIYDNIPATPLTTSNTPAETNVKLNIRKETSLDGTIRSVVYLTGIAEDIDSGHAVLGYSFKTLTLDQITPIVTASTNYTIVNIPSSPLGMIEVAYSRKEGVAPGTPTVVNIAGVPTTVLDLFEVTFDLAPNVNIGDAYSIWLSKNSPNNLLLRSVERDVENPVPPAVAGDKEWVILPMLYEMSTEYIFETVSSITLTVHIQLPFTVKNNLSQAQQGFYVAVEDALGAGELFEIWEGANPDPYGTHEGATLVAVKDLTGNVKEYILTLPGFVPTSQHTVTIAGLGYHTVTRNVTMNTDLAVYVWNNIRSLTGANFLAGDVVENADPEVVSSADFVALAAQYFSPAPQVKYDLNRDQKIDLYDVTTLLLNMKTFRTTYLNINTGLVR